MQRYETKARWHLVDQKDLLQVDQTRIVFRSEEPANYFGSELGDFSDELLLGKSDGEVELYVRYPMLIRVSSEGRVWINDKILVQLHQASSSEVFTSLDRPALLSPEMAQVQRMMKANEIERERMRSDMERFRHELARSDDELPAGSANPVGEDGKPVARVPDKKASGVRPDSKSGETGAEKPEVDPVSEPPADRPVD